MLARQFVPAVLVLATGVVAVIFLSRFEERIERSEATIRSLIEMQARPYFKIAGKTYFQQPDESREDFNARVKRIIDGTESPDSYLCDTLRRCDVPGGTVEVCTPCNQNPPSAGCIAAHAADVAAACSTFSCEDCP